MDNITDLPPGEFIAICAGWKEDHEKAGTWDVIQEDINANVLKCPVHKHAEANGMCKQTIGGTAKCPICGNHMCPSCSSHAVDIMSRVTGYLQVVSGWQAAKKQEFKDRTRYAVG